MKRPQNSDDSAQWFLRKAGRSQKIGPINRKQLSELWHEERLAPDDQLFAQGILPDWIPVGKLHNFLTEYTSGWRNSRPADSRAIEVADSTKKIFLVENGQRRGPIDLEQLQALVTWNVVAPATDVLNAGGQRCTTVDQLLETGTCPQPPLAAAAQQTLSQTDGDPQRTISHNGRSTNSKPVNKPAAAPRPPPPAQRRRVSRRIRRKSKARSRAPRSSPARQQEALAAAPPPVVARSRQAETTVDRPPLLQPSSRPKRPQRERSGRSYYRLLRSVNYSRACTLWSAILVVQALVVLTVTNALFAMFLRRMGGLCLSTFIPFGSTPEELKQEALLLAGFATILVGLLMAFPLWHLLRTDSLRWHTIATLVVGFLLGMQIKPDAVPPLLGVTRFVLVVGGIAMATICVWLMASSANAKISMALLVPLAITILCIGGFVLSDVRQMFEIDIAGLPPNIAGRLPHTGMFLLCLYAASLAFPAFCYFALSGEVSDAVKQFLDAHLILAVGTGIVMLASAWCLFQPRPDQFMSIPLALIPIAAVNAVVSMVPPAVWMTHPGNIGIR